MRHPGKVGGIDKPEGMPDDLQITLRGGSTLIFDDFGLLKYQISNGVGEPDHQSRRIAHLYKTGHDFKPDERADLAALHQARSQGFFDDPEEAW